ncbi:MAG: 4-diphosphocytidyl-2-C-methyl-D-erythritol kinase [Solirubrobacteraceae bacterium]|nr:4-diphosphocytidyl-2-C-methyl-D-erythritol kinase [Solirubrobacteraceae bacterium]
MTRLAAAAPGKVNLCLYLGPVRDDGLHELVTVIQPLDLADELTLQPAAADEVVCPGVEGENLAARALRAYREAAGGGHHRLTIDKRVPVAAGMGGGSSDAAAALRLAAHAAGHPDDPRIARIAPRIGADVPALLHSQATLVTGAGEDVATLPGPALARSGPASHADWTFVTLPAPAGLSTAEVYAEADRLGLARPADGLALRRGEVEAALGAGGLPAELVHNDLQDAARSLHPPIDDALAAARAAGADAALVSGSGPTVVALFTDSRAAEELAQSWPKARTAAPAPAGFGKVREA